MTLCHFGHLYLIENFAVTTKQLYIIQKPLMPVGRKVLVGKTAIGYTNDDGFSLEFAHIKNQVKFSD